MMKILSRFLKNSLALIPFPLAVLPYALTYSLTLWGTGLSRSSLWPRNSYYFGRIIMLVSDLDLTLFLSRGHLLQERMRKRLLRLQKLLPLLGELNVVHESMISKYAPFLPVLELKRDPILLRTAELNLSPPQEAEKFFFLSRMLWSDRKNLRVDPQLRKKKWTFHLESLQLDPRLFGEVSELGDFLQRLDSEFECSMGYLQQLPFQDKKKMESLRQELKLVFFLSDWLGDLYKQRKWEEEESWPVLGPELHHILRFSLSWEVWGVLTQFELHSNLREFYIHIVGLKKISSHYSFECYLPVLSEVEGLVLDRMALST